MSNIVEIIVRAVDKTKAGLTSPIGNIAALQKSVSNLGPAFTALAASAAAAFVAMSKSAINTADAMSKQAQSAGVTTESFSTMAYAADISGVSNEKLSKSFKDLNGFIAGANAGAEKNRDVFTQLGIAYANADGSLKNADETMIEIANVFQRTADGAGKSAAAVQLFGKAGLEMIPFLNQGADGIRALQEEARALGQEFSTSTGKEAEEFNDNLTRMKSAITGVARQFVAGILPTLVQYSEMIVKAAKDSGFFIGLAGTLVDVFKHLVVGLRFAYAGFQVLGKIIGTVAFIIYELASVQVMAVISVFRAWVDTTFGVIKGLISLGETAGRIGEILYHFFSGNFSEAWESSKSTVEEMRATIVRVGTEIADSWKKNGNAFGDSVVRSYENIKAATKELAKDIKTDISSAVNFGLNMFGGTSFKMPALEEGKKPQLNLIDTEALRKNKQQAEELLLEMRAGMENGAAQLFANEERRYQKRLNQIENLRVAEDEKLKLQAVAAEEHEIKLTEIQAQQLAIRAELDQAAKDGDVARAVEAIQQIGAAELVAHEARQNLIQLYVESVRQSQFNLTQLLTNSLGTFKSGLSNAISGLITGTMSLKQAFVQLGQSMLKTVADYIANWIAGALVRKAVETTTLASTVAASTTAAASIAAAWASAAALVAVASFGGAGAAGTAGLLAAFATSKGIAVAGQFHAGSDYVPREGSYLINKGERVVQPEANQDLTNFLANQRSGGGGGLVNVVVNLDGDVLAKGVGKMSSDGRLTISARAIV